MRCKYCATRFYLNKDKKSGTPFQKGADGYGKCMIVEDVNDHEFELVIPYDANYCFATCKIKKCPFCGSDLVKQTKGNK